MSEDRVVFTPQEKQSAAWIKLQKYLEQRLSLLRAQNDVDKPEGDTARLRGRIYEVKSLMALNADEPTFE